MKTKKEKHQFIVDNYKTMSNKELSEKTGYSEGYVGNIKHRLKLRRSKYKRKQKKVFKKPTKNSGKYDRILMIAKKHGCKRTTDLIDIFGFEKWKEICKNA